MYQKHPDKWLLVVLFLFVYADLFPAGEVVGSPEGMIKETGNDSLDIELLLQMGDHFEHTDYESAMLFYQKALAKAEKSLQTNNNQQKNNTFESLRLKVFSYIAFLNKSWAHYDKAIDDYERIMNLYDFESYPRPFTKAHISIGNIYYYQSMYPQALNYYNKAYLLAEENADTTLLGNTILNLANTYYLIGHYVKSLSYYHQALQLYPDPAQNANIGIIYLGMGNIQSSLGNFDQSLEQYNLALDVYDELADHSSMANIYLSKGALYYEFQRVEEAEENYKKALYHAGLMSNERMMAQSLLNLGILYSSQEDFALAFENYNNALAMAQSTNNLHIQTFILRNMAVAWHRQGNLSAAANNALQSLKIAQEIHSIGDQAQTYKVLSEIREKQNNPAQALSYLKLHKTFNDSLMNIDKQRQLNEMEAIYHTEQQQQLLEIASLELERNRAQLKQNNQVITTVIIVAILLLISGIFILKHNNHRIKANRLLKKQENIIAEGRKYMQELSLKLGNQKASSNKLSKKLCELEQNLQRYNNFTQDIYNFISPSHEFFSNHFKEKGFLLGFDQAQNNGSFLWSHKQGEKMLIAAANCHFDTTEGLLSKLLMATILEELVAKKSFSEPAALVSSALKKTRSVISKHTGKDISICLAVLLIDSKNYKIKFAGENLPLYLAIARNPVNAIPQNDCDYQELQILQPAEENNNSNGYHSSELQLKKSDRLYFILDSKQYDEESQSNVVGKEIITHIDNNQNLSIDDLHTFLTGELKGSDRRKTMQISIPIAAIEL